MNQNFVQSFLSKRKIYTYLYFLFTYGILDINNFLTKSPKSTFLALEVYNFIIILCLMYILFILGAFPTLHFEFSMDIDKFDVCLLDYISSTQNTQVT